MYEFPKSKKINDQCFGNPNISGMLPLEKAIEIRPSIPKSRVKPKKRILELHDNRKPTKNDLGNCQQVFNLFREPFFSIPIWQKQCPATRKVTKKGSKNCWIPIMRIFWK